MNFKNVFFISIILLAIFSISAISAEDVADINEDVDIISADLESVDVISTDVISEESIIQENSSDDTNIDDNSSDDTNDDGNSSDENTTQSSIESSDVVKYFKNDTQFEATFYDAEGNPLVNQTVKIGINGAEYNRTTNANGGIKFSINLSPGNYVIKSTNPVTNETVFNNVTVLPTIRGNDVVKSYKNATQYLVNVVDGQGNPLKNSQVQFNINGIFYNRTTNEKGVAQLNINLIPGPYVVTAFNMANGDRISNNVTVLSTIEGKDVKKYYKNATQYYANFTDGQGNPLDKTEVQFNINGVFYKRTTDQNGMAKLNINLAAGTYTLTAINPVTTEQKSNTITVLSKVVLTNSNTGGNVSMEYKSGGKFTVRLYNDNGSLAQNKVVTFNINGVLYKRTSDENGTASLNINLNPGNYVITSEFEGCKISNLIKIRVTPSIKMISNSTLKVNESFQFRLTEKNSGNPVTGEHYGILYYNNTAYGSYPDSTGLVTFILRLPADSYLFYFGTIDDGYYSSILTANTIKIVN
jgi:uncharacterized protein (DUF2141 family)